MQFLIIKQKQRIINEHKKQKGASVIETQTELAIWTQKFQLNRLSNQPTISRIIRDGATLNNLKLSQDLSQKNTKHDAYSRKRPWHTDFLQQ